MLNSVIFNCIANRQCVVTQTSAKSLAYSPFAHKLFFTGYCFLSSKIRTTFSLGRTHLLLLHLSVWKYCVSVSLCLEWVFVLAYLVRRSCFSARTFNSASFQLLSPEISACALKNNLFITLEGQEWINSLLLFLFISSNSHSAPTKDNQGFATE